MRFSSAFIVLIALFLCTSCAENYGCVERVTVADNVTKEGNTFTFTFTPSYWVDLPCDDNITELQNTSEILKNFTYKVLSFNFISDTGNNSSKLNFEIALENNNNFSVEGLPIFTMRIDGVEFNKSYTSETGSCSTVGANETCILTYDGETSFDVEKIESLELVSVKYLLVK